MVQPPEGTQEIIKTHFNKDFPLTPEDFSTMFASAFLRSAPDLNQYADVTEEISNRMMHYFKSYRTLNDFLLETKNKSCTYSRLCRCAAHILLELRRDTLAQAKADGFAYYARILGFKKEASPLLGYLKKNTAIPLITKMALSRTLIRQRASSDGS
ncbi:MAG: nucleotidyltransferase family protein [Frisingicoccus sp.]